jgi:hypothetical protein
LVLIVSYNSLHPSLSSMINFYFQGMLSSATSEYNSPGSDRQSIIGMS